MNTAKLSRVAALFALLLAPMAPGCAGRYGGMVEMAPVQPSCRVPVAAGAVSVPSSIGWLAPALPEERLALDAWCGAAGPPVIDPTPEVPPAASHELIVVSWNVHVGAADVGELVARLRAGAFTGGVPVSRFVLLLQEARRADPSVPGAIEAGGRVARAIRAAAGRDRADIVGVARSLGLALYYAPSMRNGHPLETDEDRGNAILSTEPLSGFTAIELPFERQRRVAVSAVAGGRDAGGRPWRLRVVSAHLDSLASARRLWIAGPRTRGRQARGLLEALQANAPDEPLVIGGDLNTWLGFSDPAYRAVAEVVPDAARRDRRPTFAGLLRLDHLFARLPRGWSVGAARIDDRLGSDHHPLLARIRVSS